MPKTIKFWTIKSEDGDVSIADKQYLKFYADQLNVASLTDDEIKETFGERAQERKITLKSNSYRLKDDIARHMLVKDEKTGGERADAQLEQAARAAAVVEEWNLDDADGHPAEVSVDGYKSLAMNVAAYVDEHIRLHLAPQLVNNLDFLGLLQRKLESSGAK